MITYNIRFFIGTLIMVALLLLMLFDDATPGRIVMYIAGLFVIGSAIERLYKEPRFFATPVVYTALLLLAYLSISVSWGDTSKTGSYLVRAFGLALFWLGLILSCQTPDRHLACLANTLLWVVGMGSAYAVMLYIVQGHWQERNIGPGILYWPTLGPPLLITCGATGLAIRQHLRLPILIPAIGIIILISIYTLTSGSRAPMGAILIWIMALLFLNKNHWRRNLLFLGSLVAVLLMAAFIFPELAKLILSRGLSDRPVIWKSVLPLIAEHPWKGQGITFFLKNKDTGKALAETIGHVIPHPHSLTISTLLYGGIIGLSLLVWTTLSGIMQLCRLDSKGIIYALPVLAVVVSVTLVDTHRLIKPPQPIWFIYWLPFAIIAGLTMRIRSGFPAAHDDRPGRSGESYGSRAYK